MKKQHKYPKSIKPLESGEIKHGEKPLFNEKLCQLITALFLISLCIGISLYKINSIYKLPFFDSKDGECFFWTENAFHFRHTKLIAEGKPIPLIDKDIQYPEGLDVKHYITPVMDQVAGTLQRLFFQKTPLHVFLIHFASIFSTLSVLAVFFAAKALWRSNVGGLLSAFFYALAPASFTRTCGGGFIREDFALPFIFFSFVCFIHCLHKDSLIKALGGSLLVAIALMAWHASQFYIFLFVIGFVILFFLQKHQQFPKLSLTIFTVIMAMTSVSVPILRAKHFMLSLPLMLCYALVISIWILPRIGIHKQPAKFLCAGLIILCCLGIGIVVQKNFGIHSHVFSVLFSKLRYLGELPADGTKLPVETKLMWVSSMVTPTFKEVGILLSGSLLLGIMASARSIVRFLKRKLEFAELMVIYLVMSTIALFLLVHRLNVFTVFFLAVLGGSLGSAKTLKTKVFSIICVGICLFPELYVFDKVRSVPYRPQQEHIKNLIHFLKENTNDDEAVLSTYELGPSIAAYAKRPVILHSKFESKAIRDKVIEIYTSLYHTEEDFYKVCKKYDASLFVYQQNMVLNRPKSIRYITGTDSLMPDSAAALFQLYPEKMKHFFLIHLNPLYRVFKVGQNTPERIAHTKKLLEAKSVLNSDSSIARLQHGINFFNEGKLKEAEDSLRLAISKDPKCFMAYEILGKIYAAKGQYDKAANLIEKCLSINPDQPQLKEVLSELKRLALLQSLKTGQDD